MKLRKFLALLLFVWAALAGCGQLCRILAAGANTDDGNVYFNAATENYLQGNFTSAVENLEKAQAAEPGNPKIKDFMVKILLEAATQSQLGRNYKQAFEYLKKAQKIAPDDPRVREMYQLTDELLNPKQEKTIPRDKPPVSPAPETIKDDQPARAERSKRVNPAKTEIIYTKLPLPAQPENLQKRGIAAGALFILCMILTPLLIAKSRKYTALSREHSALLNEKNEVILELEKNRERVKYEQQISKRLQEEVKDIRKKDEERMKAEMDIRARQAEERIRGEFIRKQGSTGERQEVFFSEQKEKFLQFIGDSVQESSESTPAVEAIRKRISSVAQNLYEYAPGAAIDFLQKMSVNDNPLIRSNIVMALSQIASPETLEILFKLFKDNDSRVKREVIKNLNSLKQKIGAGVAQIEKASEARIAELLGEEKTKGEWIF